MQWVCSIADKSCDIDHTHHVTTPPGLVSSGVMTTLMQVYSRVFIVWAIVEGVAGVSENIGLLLVCFAWGITEVVRYSYYFCALLDSIPYALQWCRSVHACTRHMTIT